MAFTEVVLQVGDVDAAVRFYTSAFGFRLIRTVPAGDAKVAELDAGGQRLTLVPARAPGVRLVLRSDDVDGDVPRIQRLGGTVEGGEPVDGDGGRWLGVTDPWGNRLGCWQERRP